MTHRRVLGSFLGESERPQEAAAAKPTRDTDRVRAALKADPQRWLTAHDLADLAGLSVSRVNGGVYGIIRQGAVERELSPHDGRRKHGQRYRWVAGRSQSTEMS